MTNFKKILFSPGGLKLTLIFVGVASVFIFLTSLGSNNGSVKQEELLNNTSSFSDLNINPSSEKIINLYEDKLNDLKFYKPLYNVAVESPIKNSGLKFNVTPESVYFIEYKDIDEKQYLANLGSQVEYLGSTSVKVSTSDPDLLLGNYLSLLNEAYSKYGLKFTLESISSVNYNSIGDSEFESAYLLDSYTNRISVYVITINNFPLTTPRGVAYIKVNKDVQVGTSLVEIPRFFPVSSTVTNITESVQKEGDLHIVGYVDPNFSTLINSYKDSIDSKTFTLSPQIFGPVYVLYIEDKTIIPVLSFLGFISDSNLSNLLDYPNIYFGIF